MPDLSNRPSPPVKSLSRTMALCLLAGGASPLMGTTTEWNSDSSGAWLDAANWTIGLPDLLTNVLIDRPDASPEVTIDTGAASALSLLSTERLRIINGGSLQLSGVASLGDNLALDRGVLIGGTYNFTGGSRLILGNAFDNEMRGVMINGEVDGSSIGSRVIIDEALTLNGQMTLSGLGANARLRSPNGDVSLNGAGTINLGGSLNFLTLDPGVSVTIGSDFQIRGGGTIIANLPTGSGGVITNGGTIAAGTAGMTLNLQVRTLLNSGTLTSEGGTLVINPAEDWTNHGLIDPGTGVIDLHGNISGTGLVRNTGGTLRIYDTLDLSAGSFDFSGGSTTVFDTVVNTGQALHLAQASGLTFGNNATWRGGTIYATSDAQLNFGTSVNLESVKWDGPMTPVFNAGLIRFRGESSVSGDILLDSSGLSFADDFEFLGHQIALHGNGGIGIVDAFELGETQAIVVSETNSVYSYISGTSGTFVNRGLIDVTPGSRLEIDVDDWSNNGVIQVGDSARLVLRGGSFSLGGGSLVNHGRVDFVEGTLLNDGNTLEFPGSGTYFLGGILINAGAINLPSTPNFIIGNPRFNDVSIHCDGVTLDSNQRFEIYDNSDINGVLTLLQGGQVETDIFTNNAATLGGSGTILLEGGEISSRSDLELGPDLAISGSRGAVRTNGPGPFPDLSIMNRGTIRALPPQGPTDTPGVLIFAVGHVDNLGLMEATPGSVLSVYSELGGGMNTGVMQNLGGILVARSMSNHGLFETIAGQSTLSHWDNTNGLIRHSDGLLEFGDDVTLGGQSLEWTGGTITVTGTVDNTGHTLSLIGPESLVLPNTGRVIGGTIQITDAYQPLLDRGVLEDVTITGHDHLFLDTARRFDVAGALSFDGTIEFRDQNSSVRFLDESATTNGVDFHSLAPNSSVPPLLWVAEHSTLTITADTIISGGSMYIGTGLSSGQATNRTIVNQGVIRAEDSSGAMVISGQVRELTNSGVLSAESGHLSVLARTMANDGVMSASDGGRLAVLVGFNGLTNSGTILADGGEVQLDAGPTSMWSSSGVVQAIHGGLIHSTDAPTNVGANTLTGGTWIADRSTIEIPGSIRINNAAIQMRGDTASFPLMQALRTNNGEFAIHDGFDHDTFAGTFFNNGSLTVGHGSDLVSDSSIEFIGDSASLAIIIGGDGLLEVPDPLAMESVGQLLAIDDVTLNDTPLMLSQASAFEPMLGDSWDIVVSTSGSILGFFDFSPTRTSNGLYFALEYLPDRVRVHAVVPAPASCALCFAIAHAAYRRRRSQSR